MRWILGLVGALLGGLAGEEEGLFLGLALGMLVGFIIEREQKRSSYAEGKPLAPVNESFEQRATARILELSERVARLERTVAELSKQSGARDEQAESEAPIAVASPPTNVAAAPTIDDRGYPISSAAAARVAPDADAGTPAISASSVPSTTNAAGHPRQVSPEPVAAPSRVAEALRELLFGGNTVVRVGIVVLTVGLGLLAKYAADQAYFPLELRLASAAALGTGLIVLGYRLHDERPGFGTALQGGGIAALYLVTFFAFYSYGLLPVSLTLPLLIAIAALSSVLAVAQDAQQLAVFGALGGFLAPILASSGGGNHIALFSYYALLNAGLLGVALFRSWRLLNWTGFVFTFGIASAWGALKYEPANMGSASAFLALFFLFYVLDGTLFALRQPGERRGTIDTTLTFGTPLATLALASGLFHEAPLYLALACAAMAGVYLGSARVLIARADPALAILSQAYIAIGVGVATLAIPFALENALATALAWAVEASGLLWVGCRQARLRTRVAGYLLFLASVFALLARVGDASKGGAALFCALIAAALAFGAGCIARGRGGLRAGEPYVGHVLLLLGVFLYLGATHLLADASFVARSLHDLCLLVVLACSVLLLDATAAHFAFVGLRKVVRFALPYLLLNLPFALSSASHPFADFAWAGWLTSILAGYWVLRRQETVIETLPTLRDLLHASGAWLIAGLGAVEASFALREHLLLAEGWVDGFTLLTALSVVVAVWRRLPRWPVATHPRAYALLFAWPLTLLICCAALLRQAESSGSPAPLPYVPLLNPLDLAHLLAVAALLALARDEAIRSSNTQRIAVWGSAVSVFILLNATVVRSAHYWADVAIAPWEVPSDPLVQASFSILWTLLALVAMIAAQRTRRRSVWIVGAVLLSGVVLKLFFLDLAALGSVTKIITFLAVGVLLLLVGYFAPVPPMQKFEEKQP